jgi:hypothetical protein
MQGRRLSVVQAIGVELLYRQDNLDKGHDLVQEFRLAQVAAGQDPKGVYAEYFAPVETVDTAEGLDEIDLDEADFSGVEWQSPSEMGEDELTLLQQFMADDRVNVSERGLPGPGEWH